VIKDDVACQIAELKDRYDGDILVNSSAKLMPLEIDNDLVDE
jgi:hypothetical protein